MSKQHSYRWLMQQSVSARTWLIGSILLGLFAGILIILQADFLAHIINRVYIHHATRSDVSFLLWAFLIVIAGRGLLSWCREITGFQTAKHVKDKVRQSLFQHLIGLNPTDISKYKTGALTTTLIEQVDALHDFYANYLPQMMLVVTLPIIILIIVFMQNWVCGLVLLITGPLIPLFMALIGMGVESLNQRHFQSMSRMSAHFLNILQGLTTLSLFNRAKAQIKEVHDMSASYRDRTMRVLRVAFLSSAVLELFSTVSIAIIAVYLGLGLLGIIGIGFDGFHITLQHALFILLLAPEFFLPLRQLGIFYHARAEAIGAGTEILKILKKELSTTDTDQQMTFQANQISLVFKDVGFSYHEKTPILKHISLLIKTGLCIAITGPSGVGKSTLLNLIAKFITPTTGSITVGDIPIKNIDNDSWRENISLLSQHLRLFHGTIESNIRLAKTNATDTEIEEAVRICGVSDFSRQLPLGLQTPIGDNNLGLSGGQAQRVALARMVLKNAPLILLDEPTAHLDTKNKAIIAALINQWRGRKTIIITTHDHEILSLADHVYQLKSGELHDV